MIFTLEQMKRFCTILMLLVVISGPSRKHKYHRFYIVGTDRRCQIRCRAGGEILWFNDRTASSLVNKLIETQGRHYD